MGSSFRDFDAQASKAKDAFSRIPDPATPNERHDHSEAEGVIGDIAGARKWFELVLSVDDDDQYADRNKRELAKAAKRLKRRLAEFAE